MLFVVGFRRDGQDLKDCWSLAVVDISLFNLALQYFEMVIIIKYPYCVTTDGMLICYRLYFIQLGCLVDVIGIHSSSRFWSSEVVDVFWFDPALYFLKYEIRKYIIVVKIKIEYSIHEV